MFRMYRYWFIKSIVAISTFLCVDVGVCTASYNVFW
jgi:hypothetical protein